MLKNLQRRIKAEKSSDAETFDTCDNKMDLISYFWIDNLNNFLNPYSPKAYGSHDFYAFGKRVKAGLKQLNEANGKQIFVIFVSLLKLLFDMLGGEK